MRRVRWGPWPWVTVTLAILAPGAGGAAAAGWFDTVRSRVAAAEYHVTWQPDVTVAGDEGAWHAPNRHQGFRTWFADDRIVIEPRDGSAADWNLTLRPLGLGRPGRRSPLAEAIVVVDDGRIDYLREGLVEWYVNEPRGLKQSFRLPAPPGAPARDGEPPRPVELDLELAGDLLPRIDADGRGADLVDARGARVLRYARLAVHDATGRELPSRIEAFASAGVRGLRLIVDDRGAVYPVTVDPLFESPAWSAEGEQIKARFGVAVATAGDVDGDGFSDLIVGADQYDNGEFDEGRVFLFPGSATGPSFVPVWTAEGDQDFAGFGIAVGTAGDVNGDGYSDVIVGADAYDGAVAGAGAAFVFHGGPGGLAATPAWSAEGLQTGEEFGSAAGVAGDVNGDGYSDVIVGARGFANGQDGEGRALVFAGSRSGLGSVPVWQFEGDQPDARLGEAVATAGDVNGDGYADVIVGAPGHDEVELDEGRARVFEGAPGGLGTTPAWTADGGQEGAGAGAAVAPAGDTDGDGFADVLLGAPLFDAPAVDAGHVWLFRGGTNGLLPFPSWEEDGTQEDARFGASLFAAGDVNGDGHADVVVGEPRFDGEVADEGRAHVFHGAPLGLESSASWTVEGDQRFSLFGFAVATAGDVNGDGYADVIVGARDHGNGEDSEGRAWVYLGGPAGLPTTPGWFTEGNDSFAEYGVSVASAGDVNGDGFADLLIGARLHDAPQNNEGRVSIFHGASAGPAEMATGVASGAQTGEEFGTWVASAGDVNNDGYDDVIAGAPFFDNGEFAEGRAVVFHGSENGLMVQAWSVEGDQAQARLGGAVAGAGDVNGDGYADVVVVASGYDDPESSEGVAFVYHGSPTGLATTPAWQAGSNQINGLLSAAGPAGDVNGDGYDDVIVGASLFDNGLDNEGVAFVFHGSATGLGAAPAWVREGDEENARFGSAVWGAGDVNGDGYADVIVGMPFASAPTFREGRAFVYHGSPAGLSTVPAWFVESDQENAGLGVAVASAGDVNADGFADVIVGALRYSNGQNEEGAAFVYHGSAAGLSTIPAWVGESDQADADFGRSVAGAGDVNGDGYADVIVGARAYANGQSGEGRAFLFYGNDGGGLSSPIQQRTSDDAVPIAQLGASDSEDRFRIAARGRSPYGRGRVRLEWEVRRLGEALDGSNLTRGLVWVDTGVTGATLNELVAGLDPEPRYHWRARLIHDPVTTPFQGRGRWSTNPVNGWQEADLRMAGAPPGPGAVPDGATVDGPPLTVDKLGGHLLLEWGASCGFADTGYVIYEGTLGQFDSPVPAGGSCNTHTLTEAVLPLPFADAFYLVVPINGTDEGSYGTDSAGFERPASQLGCLPQSIGGCAP